MSGIAFHNLKPVNRDLLSAYQRVVDSGVYLYGRETELFEQEWARYCGTQFCVAVANGTDAVSLAVYGAGSASVSIPALAPPCTMYGAKRVAAVQYIDISPELDSRASLPVPLYGRFPSELERGKWVIDCAQAAGWKPPGRATCAWSFYPTKSLGTLGDAGAVTTNDERTYERIRAAVNVRVVDSGFHMQSRICELQAAFLRAKLPYLDDMIASRTALAEIYLNEIPESVRCPIVTRTAWHLFPILSERRNELREHLKRCGVETLIHYPVPLADMTNARRICDTELSLPLWHGMTPEQVRMVCDSLKGFT